jgi:hypothetical protein
MTQFEQAVQQAKEGKLQPPTVSNGGKQIDYFWYQLCSHHFYMKIFAAGMTARNAKLKDYKVYYGLKGRSAKDCLVEFEKIMNDYKEKMNQPAE